MKTLVRKDELRLAAITLFRAELILLVIGLIASLYDVFGNDKDNQTVIVMGLISLGNMLSLAFLIFGLKKSKYVLLGIGYFISTVVVIADFYLINLVIEAQAYSEQTLSVPFLVCLVIFIIFLIFVIALLARQSKAEGGITDADKKKWIIPGVLYITAYFGFFVAVFVKYLDYDEIRYMIMAMMIIFFIGLMMAKLLELVGLFCCMKWLTCPEIVENDSLIEGGAEE